MKQALINLLFSLIAFSIAYSISQLTGLALIQQAVLIDFVIQWILFIPAFIFQTEKFYDLTGSATIFITIKL
jgi:type III secretory pathway component EscU